MLDHQIQITSDGFRDQNLELSKNLRSGLKKRFPRKSCGQLMCSSDNYVLV